MKVVVFNDYEELSDQAADDIIELVSNKKNAVLVFASGHTPLRTCELLVKKVTEQAIDLTQCTFVGLDEWVGIEPGNEGSCNFFFYKNLFEPLHIQSSNIFLFNGLSADLGTECKKMDEAIKSKGGIDMMIVGIGGNGHIGFNEPGVDSNKFSHVAELAEETKIVGQKYFTGQTHLTKGITLGFGHINRAKKVILVANGSKKAQAIQQSVEGVVSASMPASFLQTLDHSFFYVDKEAASLLHNHQAEK